RGGRGGRETWVLLLGCRASSVSRTRSRAPLARDLGTTWSRKGRASTRRVPYAARVEVAVLGPVRVRLDGAEVDLGTPKQRALVAALALSAGRPGPGATS